jgi:uncharacterized membrane protein YuzA (DUF378 family)
LEECKKYLRRDPRNTKTEVGVKMMIANKIALVLSIIGSLNWGLVGLFGFDLVAFITGNMTVLARIIYILVAIAGVWCITMLFHGNDEIAESRA